MPVYESVREAPRPLAHRLESDSDHGRRQDREGDVRSAGPADEGAEADHDRDIDGREEGRQDAEDKRLVDHEIDVVEAVAKDRDSGGQGQHRPAQQAEDLEGMHQSRGNEARRPGEEEQAHGKPDGGDKPLELLALVAARAAVAHDDRDRRGDDAREDRKDSRPGDDVEKALGIDADGVVGLDGRTIELARREREGSESARRSPDCKPGDRAPTP